MANRINFQREKQRCRLTQAIETPTNVKEQLLSGSEGTKFEKIRASRDHQCRAMPDEKEKNAGVPNKFGN